MLLSDVIIHSATDNSLDTAEFKLEHNKIIYSLTAATNNEKVLWLKKLKEAQEVVLHSDKCKLQRQQSSKYTRKITKKQSYKKNCKNKKVCKKLIFMIKIVLC